MNLEVYLASSPADIAAIDDLRYRILRQPWGKTLDLSEGTPNDPVDSKAESSSSAIAKLDGIAVGTARLHFNSPSEGQIRYMAVETGLQGKGIGKAIVRFVEAEAIARGAYYMVLNAREIAVPFYLSLGYTIVRESEPLWGMIPHFWMEKALS